MKIKRTIVGVAAVAAALAVAGVFYLCHTNKLGLTGFDTLMGERPEMSMLRTNTQAAADAFLARSHLINAEEG